MTSRIILPMAASPNEHARQQSRMHSVESRPADTLVVHEIYASIQGESTYAGLPCTFVRLTGCPLRCRWCDTPHAFREGHPMTIPQIVSTVEAQSPRMVEVTGGEPLAQPECAGLLATLADRGFRVLLETSGALPIDHLDSRVIVILDMKCPSSREEESNNYDNLKHLKPVDELKFVMASREDFDWAVGLLDRTNPPVHAVLFSPVHGELPPERLAQWIVESGRDVRLQIALHKVIWGSDARGV